MDLSGIPAIDQHAHNVVRSDIAAQTPYSVAFTEGYDPTIVNHHARRSFCYARSLRDIAALLDCEPTEAAILAQREKLGFDGVSDRCFKAANLSAILLDDGFLSDHILSWEWHQQFAPTYRLLRLEWLAETLISQSNQFETFLEWFRSELDPPPPGVVGFKSIAAYRTGLDIQPTPLEVAEAAFYEIKAEIPEGSVRLMNKPLIDFLVHFGLEIAAQHQLPVQFHTGFGDPDLDLRLANPLHLRLLLEEPRYRQAPIVLLHAAYPFMREAGYLAAVYPQVYVDFGLAVPLLSVQGMRQVVQMLLELSPTSKVMYASDAHFIPELYYLGAKWGRMALATVLEQAVQDGDLSAQEADAVAIAILQQNASNLYQLSAKT
jgi:uncharacterized protein